MKVEVKKNRGNTMNRNFYKRKNPFKGEEKNAPSDIYWQKTLLDEY